MFNYDRIIIGAGLYGLYAAAQCGKRGEKVLVLEYDDAPFARATYINQARVHMGYHYPRSLSTALKSAGYFKRFCEDYGFSILTKFDQVYATSSEFSWTNAEEFVAFCKAADIRCEEVSANKYFKPGAVDGAFLTEEYTYDAHILRDFFLKELHNLPNVILQFGVRLQRIIQMAEEYQILYKAIGADQIQSVASPFVLNATYASTNQIMAMVEQRNAVDSDFKPFGIKYELCEIILCNPSERLQNTGITVMDGPFFSIMPFGLTGQHSLTSVTFTPHVTSYDTLPKFTCQNGMTCQPSQLCNCNECPNRPDSAWPYMKHLADRYLLPEYGYTYDRSLFSMKPILKSSEVDDSRPTAIRINSMKPTFVSVLSGKINTVYDLDIFLQ